MPTRRNIYAERLLEFPGVAFGGQRVFDQRGQWQELFSARIGPAFDGPVVLEIGCSDASTLCEIAAKYPRTGFVGVDWKFKSLYLAAARVAEMRLSNVVLLRGRAQEVARIFAPGEVDEAWVFHPEPCDRPNELRNRLIAEPFLLNLYGVLRGAGSRVCLKTDHPGYYQWTLGLLGLPEPDWTARRVKRKELADAEAIPAASDAVLKRFDVALTSHDFWNDPAAQNATRGRCFAGLVTPFEGRFVRKRLPIYYVELARSYCDPAGAGRA